MKQVKINLTDELDFNEYRKQICFFSQKITSFRREGNSLIIECEDNANTDKIEKKANDALKKNLESKKEDIVIDEHLKSKRQTMRQSLKSTPPIIGDVASCIRPEDYLTMA